MMSSPSADTASGSPLAVVNSWPAMSMTISDGSFISTTWNSSNPRSASGSPKTWSWVMPDCSR